MDPENIRRVYADASRGLTTDSQRGLFNTMLALGLPALLASGDSARPTEEGAAHRHDAQTLAIAARQLEHVITETYLEEFADLPMAEGQIIHLDSSIPEGAKTFVWYAYTGRAIARFSAAYATGDAPRASIQGAVMSGRVQSIEGSYGYHVSDQRAAAYAGIPLDAMLGSIERRAHAEKHQETLLYGREDLGLPGLLTHPGISIVDAPADGTGGSRTWASKSVAQIMRDITVLVRSVERLSFGKRKTTTVLLPRDTMIFLETTWLGQGDGTTLVIELIRKAHPGVEFIALNELSASLSGGHLTTDAAFAFVKDRKIIRGILPMPFRQYPPQIRNLETVIPCESTIGGVVLIEPPTVVRMDGVGQS